MKRLLKNGSRGEDVKALQDVLNYHIRRLPPLAVDGIFGPKTEAHVREFQRSNQIKVDGIVGPQTNSLLYEETVVSVDLLLLPRLTMPSHQPWRISPPQLIPPLQFPTAPGGTIPPPLSFHLLHLSPNSFVHLPPLGSTANAFQLQITVPTRNDPLDPHVAAHQHIVRLIDDLPVNSRFKAFLVGKIPNPVKKITPPTPGFHWGVSPLFNPLDPTGFGAKGNAAFNIEVTPGNRPEVPHIFFSAWGDGKFELDFSRQNGQSRPAVKAEGKMMFGVIGVF